MVEKLSYHCTNRTENFSLTACLQMKLWLVKFGKSDACIRPFLQIRSHIEKSLEWMVYICTCVIYTIEALIHCNLIYCGLFYLPLPEIYDLLTLVRLVAIWVCWCFQAGFSNPVKITRMGGTWWIMPSSSF